VQLVKPLAAGAPQPPTPLGRHPAGGGGARSLADILGEIDEALQLLALRCPE
jgi:hypothetical protein